MKQTFNVETWYLFWFFYIQQTLQDGSRISDVQIEIQKQSPCMILDFHAKKVFQNQCQITHLEMCRLLVYITNSLTQYAAAIYLPPPHPPVISNVSISTCFSAYTIVPQFQPLQGITTQLPFAFFCIYIQ